MNIYDGQLTALLGHNGAGEINRVEVLVSERKIFSRKEYNNFDDYRFDSTDEWSDCCSWI